LSPEDRSNVEGRLAELKTALAGEDMAAISAATDALMSASQEFSQKLYEQAAASEAAGGGTGNTATPNDDEVVDAEIVDDEES
jgi:molecular chaperone DnaK